MRDIIVRSAMALTLSGISHRFGSFLAVNDASLAVRDGEIVCLFGPSGCGKTTLLRVAAGLERLQAGAVRIDGETVAEPGRGAPPERRPIGFVFQDYVLFPHMTVGQNVGFGVKEQRRDARKIVVEELAAVGLADYEKRAPHELSGGQQQRVALARAMARRPRALLLDEPFASIDTVLRRRLREELRRLLKARDVAVVLVTHDPEEALAIADRIALMREGQIVETATPADLFRMPATPDGAAIFPDSQQVFGAVRNGAVETAFGRFVTDQTKEGPAVIVFRAGALSGQVDSDGPLRVVDARFSGPGWTVFLAGGSDDQFLRVRMDAPPEIGAAMRVNADPAGQFVFCLD